MPSTLSLDHSAATASPSYGGLDELSFYLARLYHHYCLALEAELRRQGLPESIRPGVGPLLFALFEREGQTLRELGAATDLAPSTLTELVQKLDRAGIISRERCERDGRAVRVSLTPLGRSVQGPMGDVCRTINGLLYGQMTAEEIGQLKQAFVRMIRDLVASRRQIPSLQKNHSHVYES